MALKAIVDSLDGVPEAQRALYVQKDGKWHLDIEGGYASAADLAQANARLTEFRNNNIALTQEIAPLRTLKEKLGSLDPAEAAAAHTELAKLKAKGVGGENDLAAQISAAVKAATEPLVTQVTQLQTSNKEAVERANKAILRTTIGEQFGKAGGVPSALDFIVSRADGKFVVDNGQVKAAQNVFSTDRPGEPLTVEEWIKAQVREADFAFKPSSGGGANPGNGGGNGPQLRPGQTVLQNPTPSQLGDPATAKGIKEGKIKVEYSTPAA